ncbi:MAG: DNA adenine methylase [Pseudomonadota bacterium]
MTPKRPILRYHGGKWMLAPWIISHFPEHRTYVEPFAGGASVLLRKPRSFAEVYNDLDSEIVQIFKVARDDGERLARALELTPFSRTEFQESYHPTTDAVESCRRTIIRSFMGFGSDGVHSTHRTGFRGKSQRSGTTPAHDWANYPDAFRSIICRLQGVVLENKPALEVIAGYDTAETLFYVDPPYVHSTRKRVDKARGYRHEMTDEDHIKLSEALKSVSGKVIVSGYPSPLYDEIFKDWQRVEKTGAFCDGAKQRTEVLWMSPNVNLEASLF